MSLSRIIAASLVGVALVGCSESDDVFERERADQPTPAPAPSTTGTLKFTNVTGSSGIDFVHGYNAPDGSPMEWFSGGMAAGDYDGDGDVDLFFVRGDIGANKLYRNEGNMTFTDVADLAGLAYTKPNQENDRLSGPTFADMDGDGDLDLFIGGFSGSPSFIYQNNGDGTFSDVSAASGIRTMQAAHTNSAAFGDYDKDGDIDLFMSHWGTPRDVANPGDTEHLWRNISTGGNIRFESVSVEAGISATIIEDVNGMFGRNHDYTFSPTFADLNDDGYPEILSVADFKATRVFYNNGDGTFTDRTDAVIKDENGMGAAVADFDNDGDLDWFVSSINSTLVGTQYGNRMYRNNNGVLEDGTDDAGVQAGSWGWGACFLDAENDGDLDLFHVNGWNDEQPVTNFEGDFSVLFVFEDGSATNRADDADIVDSEQGRGVVCADFDNDGDVDLLTVHRNRSNSATIWRNDTEGNNAITVNLVGSGMNTEAVGARVKVTVNGVTQMREIHIGSNFTSQNPTAQVFGIGTAAAANQVEITWPDGSTQLIGNVRAGSNVTYTQP